MIKQVIENSNSYQPVYLHYQHDLLLLFIF